MRPSQEVSAVPDDLGALHDDLVHLARLALDGTSPQVHPLLRKLARRYKDRHPDLAARLVKLLRASPTRGASSPLLQAPVDNDSRLPLIRSEEPVLLSTEPVLQGEVASVLRQLLSEHSNASRLLARGLAPSRTALFVGPPGVGKTLAARWLARELGLPLRTLDLSSVMSSLLGRTGENVRRVLDFAKQSPCVLLLDELDAVAKRRDDNTEIGELKRLVTVLLQEIDAWPEGSLLLGATNHAALLDPAVWRRFEVVLEFPYPSNDGLLLALNQYLDNEELSSSMSAVLVTLFQGGSYSDLERAVLRARRTSALSGVSLAEELINGAKDSISRLSQYDRVLLAISLMEEAGLSQRRAHDLTGVSRDTIRKHSERLRGSAVGPPTSDDGNAPGASGEGSDRAR